MADLDAAIEAVASKAYNDAPATGHLARDFEVGMRAALTAAAPLIRADERAKVRAELLTAAEEWLNQANDLQRRNLVPDLQRHYADAAEQLADAIVHPGRIAPEPTPEAQR